MIEEELSIAGRTLRLRRPRDPEALLDEQQFEQDEFLPYWAELWPSGLALAEVVGALDLDGVRVIELGCGLGLPSLAAALRGADVLATDWAPDALELVSENAARNGLQVSTALWRWDEPAPGRYPLVLASDVLYERRNGPWLLDALERVLDGEALIADPGRATAQEFFAAAAKRYEIVVIPAAVDVRRLLRRAES